MKAPLSLSDGIIGGEDEKPTPSTKIMGPFGIQPIHVFSAASFPFLIGAYTGYQKQIRQFEKETANEFQKSSIIQRSSSREIIHSIDGRLLATRALAIGTMLSLGGTAALCAVTFYALGFRSWNEAVESCRSWGLRRRTEIEHWPGMNYSRNDPDRIATSSMSEEEELKYIQDKYLSDEILHVGDTNSSIARLVAWMGWKKD